MALRIAILVGLLSLAPVAAEALELRDLAIHYQRFHPSNRIPDLAGFTAKEGVGLVLNVGLVGPFYWNNRIVAMTDPGSYRLIGWNFSVGARLHRKFLIEYEHFSKHLLDHSDAAYPAGKFAVQDSLGFVWYLYRGEE